MRLVLRGSRPDERAEIVYALTSGPQKCDDDSARRLLAARARRVQERVATGPSR
jgi:hypothetical protein